ncbi:MAG: hypothetical protein NVSMB62_29760 [Acidobacteriaceae bacterium]
MIASMFRGRLLAIWMTSGAVLPACVGDGHFYVRGTVHDERGMPIRDATAKVTPCVPADDPAKVAHTDESGRFDISCMFGGMVFARIPDGPVAFSAHGYRSRTVRLRSERDSDDVKHAECGDNCFSLQVVLKKSRADALAP